MQKLPYGIVKTIIVLDKPTHQQLGEMAKSLGISKSELMRRMIDKAYNFPFVLDMLKEENHV